MAYEYERENIRKLKSYNVISGGANITKPIEELQEVYRKAEAFDEIVNLLKTDYMQCADDNLEDIEIIINEYMWEIEEDNQ
ncbi:hypothetical protein [Staphylococcus gallinarum]|uniref:hypothetical protein n=1 Tax=Staphylococcus gallinarum TaxID=1293 RepID=UPI001E4FE270|nr:hypothetical protein [Staphylococcus gallinarum]MCD8786685.1 hypothetical protein [Staphylococcus gallinarum]MCD8859270.1 hypothetical protein [Staphylococcus gallinarum]